MPSDATPPSSGLGNEESDWPKETVSFRLQTLPISAKLVFDGMNKRLDITLWDVDMWPYVMTQRIPLPFALVATNSSTESDELHSSQSTPIYPAELSPDEITRI